MLPKITPIPLLQLASGDRFFLQLYQFQGTQAGKKAYIQSNLHGAELAGNAVIYQLIEFFSSLDPEQISGEIWLMPVCNPLGTNQRAHFFSSGRFNSYDGRDWNRIFWDYSNEAEDLLSFAQSQLNLEKDTIQQNYRQRIQTAFQKLSEEFNAPNSTPFYKQYRYLLQSLCLDANYVIDLHTSAANGLDYLYYFRDRQSSVALFGLPAGILLDEYDGDAFDEAFIKPWLALEDCFAQLGRSIRFDVEAWTLELGSAMQLNPSSVEAGVWGIKNYLAHQRILNCQGFPVQPEGEMKLAVRSQVMKYYAPVGGMVQSRVALGTVVQPGQQIYQILSFNKEGKLPTLVDVTAATAGLVFDVSQNHSVHQGEYVLGVM